MKPLLFFLAIASTLMACNNNSNNSSATNDSLNVKSTNSKEAKEERNKQIVKAGTEAFSQHDVEAVARDFVGDVLDYGDGSRPPVRGVDSFKYNTSQFFKANRTIRQLKFMKHNHPHLQNLLIILFKKTSN